MMQKIRAFRIKSVITTAILILVIAGILIFGSYWINTQPVWAVDKTVAKELLAKLPIKNKRVIEFIESKGPELAPKYQTAVCTEFLIKVIGIEDPLTNAEMNDIRIITKSKLDSLIEADSPIIKGVQTALLRNAKGIEIKNRDVLPGDFVQFWNKYQGKAYGHCGIVLDIEPDKTITIYSSHPLTDGYGKQKFLWPDKSYFVRLK